MNRRFLLAALMAFATPGLAQTSPASAPTPTPAPAADLPRVAIVTADGTIVVALEDKKAPITSANFLRYVDQKRFDGTTFYRALTVKGGSGEGLIQGGVSNNPKRILPPVAHEPTTLTGLSHVDGTLSMARDKPGSAQGEFFITIGSMTYIDADPKAPGDNLGFAAFGHVVEGMDVVKKILAEPISTTDTSPMKGEILAQPVKIISARRIK
jgi:peptidyl-prolyl cis-trans isomerase A (cyclophilin A)